MEDDGTVGSVLPDANNPLSGPWQTAYSWPGLAQGVAPNAGQPDAHHVYIRISSPDVLGQLPGPGSEISYRFDLTNKDVKPLDGAALIVSGDENIRFDSLAGWPGVQAQTLGDRWFIDLGTFQPGDRDPMTITAHIVDSIANVDTVTVTAEIDAKVAPGEPDLSYQTLSHAVDSRAPTVRFNLPKTGATLAPGLQTITGAASDHGGIGIARVEVQVNDGPWMRAQGAEGWSAAIEVPSSGLLTISARSYDDYGYVSDVNTLAVTIDNEAPVASIDALGPILNGISNNIRGQATDPFPAGGAIARVEVQIDSGPWQPATLQGDQKANGGATWQRTWHMPPEEGVLHAIRARAVDVAGNVGAASSPVQVTVDSIAPASAIVYPQPGGIVDANRVLVWGLAADGWGVAQVDVSIDGGRTWTPALLGEDAMTMLASAGVSGVVPDDQLPAGTQNWTISLPNPGTDLAIRSRATDLAGNVEPLKAPVRVTVASQRIMLPFILR